MEDKYDLSFLDTPTEPTQEEYDLSFLDTPIQAKQPITDEYGDVPMQSNVPYGEALKEGARAATKGVVGGTLGFAGDIEGIGRWAVNAEDQDTLLPTIDEVRSWSDPLVDAIFGAKDETTKNADTEIATQLASFVAPVPPVAGAVKKVRNVLDAKKASNTYTAQDNARIAFKLKSPKQKYSPDVAGFKIKDDALVIDPVGQKMLALKVPPSLVSIVRNSSGSSRFNMSRMLNTSQKAAKDNYYALTKSPTEYVGSSVGARLKSLKERRKELSDERKAIVNSELKNLDVDLGDIQKELIIDVSQMFDLKPKFKDGVLALPDLEKLTPELKQSFLSLDELLKKQSNKDKVFTGADAHRLKTLLNDMLDKKSLSEAGMSNNVQRIVLDVVKAIDGQLIAASPAYANKNAQLSSIFNAVEPFEEFTKAGGLDAYNFSAKLGRGVNTNPDLLKAIDGLDTELVKYTDKFTDDPKAMVAFNQQVGDLLSEIVVRNGGAEVAKKFADAAASGAVGNTFGVVHDIKSLLAIGLSAKKAKKALKEQEETLKLIRSSLARG